MVMASTTNRTSQAPTGGAGRPAWMRPTDSVSLYQGKDCTAAEAIGRADRELRDSSRTLRAAKAHLAGGAR